MANETVMNEIQKQQAIARMNQFKKSTMTIQELYDKLGEFIKKGDGDAMIDISDNEGGSYVLSKTTNIFVLHTNEDIHGKWCYIGD